VDAMREGDEIGLACVDDAVDGGGDVRGEGHDALQGSRRAGAHVNRTGMLPSRPR
jgi:hypothetical protein